MDIFLTLTVLPAHRDALHRCVTGLRKTFGTAAVDWLCEGTAADFLLNTHDAPRTGSHIDRVVRNHIGDMPIDFLTGPVADRRKMLLIADMDSTFVTSETLDDVAAHAGLKEEIAAITARSMRGELDFEESLRARVRMIAGLPVTALLDTLSTVRLSPGADTLARTMRHHGAYTALVSGGFTLFAQEVCQWCHFHEYRSNIAGIKDDRLTGNVIGPVIDRKAKLDVLDELAGQNHVTRDNVLAIGDGANDLDMIKAAGLGIAYFGKPVLATAARANIRHTDLTTALYFQGYRHAEFVFPND